MLNRIVKIIAALLVITLLTFGIRWYIQHENLYPQTDDAYVQAHIVNIAAQVNGKVAQLNVKNQQHVNKEQVLFTIDQQPFLIALKKAQANLQAAREQAAAQQSDITAAKAIAAQRQSEMINAKNTADRATTLLKKNLYAIADKEAAVSAYKQAAAAYRAAQAQLTEAQQKLGKAGDANSAVKAALADLNQAKLNLQYTVIKAPVSGHLEKLSIRAGDLVTQYQQVFAIITDNSYWVSANFKETQLSRVKVGQKVTVTLDMYPEQKFNGRVLSISPGTGSSFALLPPENATGNWVKVTQRLPVWVSIEPKKNYPFRLGASATVSIDTTSSP
jgi:membrane fusion protein, multidrug efflux system